MPLKKSASPGAFKSNLKAEMKAGKPQKQALAIAYATKRKAMAKGGKVTDVCPNCKGPGQLCAQHSGMPTDHEYTGHEALLEESRKDMYADGGPVDGTDGSQQPYGNDGRKGGKPVYGNPDRSRDGYPVQDGRYGKTFGKASRSTDGYDGAPGAYERSIKDSDKDRQGPGGDPQRNYTDGGYVEEARKKMMDQPEAKANSKYAMLAEGGMVDDEAPLRTKRAMPGDSEDEYPTREDHLEMPLETPVDEMDSDLEQDLPHNERSMSLADEIMKDRKRRMFAKGGSVPVEPDYDSIGVGTLHGTTDPTDEMYETNDSDEQGPYNSSGRQMYRGLNTAPAHTMTDDQHDVSDASDDSDESEESLISQILADRKRRRRE